ncbi:MAG: CPBP family glutamic-type intramembrane protease [Pusillimonas sp.]
MASSLQAGLPSFGLELRDFFRFLLRPDFRRLPVRAARDSWHADWFPVLRIGRLLQWAGLLWAVNALVLGPIAIAAAGMSGAQHRLQLDNLPWLHAVLWAPLVEELVFRYGLRRLSVGVWLVPAALVALLAGPGALTLALVGLIVLASWWPYRSAALRRTAPSSWQPHSAMCSWHIRRHYRRCFFWVVHVSCLAFAAIHLANFSHSATPFWALPLLVLPQWLTGLVLAWIRVRRGFGAAVALHAVFNAGPLLVVWLILSSLSGSPR